MLIVHAFLSLTYPQMIVALTFLMVVFFPGVSTYADDPEFFDVPFANNQWNIGRKVDESQLRYCIDRRNPDWELAAEIIDAVSGALLLEPKRYEVESDFVNDHITKIYAIMLEHCDIHMGFKLIPGGYPNWVTLSRPYYHAEYVFVTTDPDITSLDSLAPTRPIGPMMGTSAHIRLISYIKTLSAENRWPIYPMGTSEILFKSLLNGKIDVALLWAPTLWAKQLEDSVYSDLHVIEPAPLPPTILGVGALMLADKIFLRTAFDEAINALIEDGTISGILKKFNFPATVKP